jgi:eukaryotic-like serine/threonine-protein kinase
MQAPSMTMLNKRYLPGAAIGSGGMGEVLACTDLLTGQPVAVKRIGLQADSPPATDEISDTLRLSLAREFSALATMRHPNIISVLDYGFEPQGKSPFIVMELLDGAQNIVEISQDLPFESRINLLLQMLQALVYLHRRGLVHRDMKPANVLVVRSPEGEHQVRVLDFGLATQANIKAQAAGTLRYMSPETYLGDPPTAMTDLYAVGVMAYEMLTGNHPYGDVRGSALVQQMMLGQLNLYGLSDKPKLQQVISVLLAKAPEDRLQSADQAIAAVCEATNFPMPPESEAIRESFLQAAKFVNRTDELAQLRAMIPQEENPRGTICLLGGESGIGKSRLVDELRIHALVAGALVIRAGSVTEQVSPYHIWRPVLRRLVIHTDLTDLQAGVLKDLVPDIETLINRSGIPTPPEIEPSAARTRLLGVIEELFALQTQPVVLLLEDLQWESDESLGVFTYLARSIEKLPVLIVGNYRNDERPDLPKEIPGTQTLMVTRLSEQYIQELSSSMLGKPGDDPRIVALLQQETEGNAFFLVEIVRALAEEAGALSRIGSMQLPEHVIAGGIRATIERRLRVLPEAAYPLLNAAAVAGRQIDLNVLSAFDSPLPMQDWLLACSDAAILDVQDNQWRFAHDKLRETILEALEEQTRSRLHEQVALRIVRAYPDSPENYAVLAYHFGQGRNLQMEAKYSALAGQIAFLSSAYQQAIALLTRALELKDAASFTTEQIAEFERLVGEAYFGIGRMPESTDHLVKAVNLLGFNWPVSQIGLVGALIGATFQQMWHRMVRVPQKRSADSLRLIRGSLSFERISHRYYFENENLPTLYAAMSALNLAEQAGPSPEVVRGFATLHIVSGIIPMHKLALYYGRLAHETAEIVHSAAAAAWVDHVSGVYYSGIGEFERGIRLLNGALEVWTNLGDMRRWQEGLTLSGMAEYRRDAVERSEEMRRQLYDSGVKTDAAQPKVWGQLGLAEIALRRGKAEQALEHLQVAEDSPEGIRLSEEIWLNGLMALLMLRLDQPVKARDFALKGLEPALKSSPNGFYALEGYSAITEVLLALWREKPSPGAEKQAQRGLKASKRFGAVFPIGKARALTWEGVYYGAKGLMEKANRLWTQAAVEADTYNVRFDKAFALLQAGQMQSDTVERRMMLERASGLFVELGDVYFQSQALAGINKPA